MQEVEKHQEDTGYRWSMDVGYDRVVIRGKITIDEFTAVIAMIKKENWILDTTAAKEMDAMFVFVRPRLD